MPRSRASAEIKAAIPALATLAGPDRRSAGPASRHHRRIDRQCRSFSGLSGCSALALARRSSPIVARLPPIAFLRRCFRPRWSPMRSFVAVRFPIPDAAGYAKFRSQASRFALVGAFVARFGSTVRVAITGAGPVVFRSADIEDALATNFSPEALARISIAPSGLELRHPCRQRVSRPSRGRDGAAGCRTGPGALASLMQ